MSPRACIHVLPVLLLGCAASTPAPNQPQQAPSGEVAVVDLNATKPPDPAPKKEKADALKEAQTVGILGVLKSDDSQGSSMASIFGRDDASGKDGDAKGSMWGDQIGESFGAGGLGLVGSGTGGTGTGNGTIGLGNIGTIGHGAGTGSGQGFGSGRLGGTPRTNPPKVRVGAATMSAGLPPEVVQRIVRQNFGRFRLCYENGLRDNPNLQGRISVKFVIDKDGSTSIATNAGSDLPDGKVVSCVVRAFTGLSFPEPEGGGSVSVVYPIMFSPGDSPDPPKASPQPPTPAAAPKAAAPAKQP